MKILAASDIHGNERTAKHLADEAEKYDVDLVLIAGDISNWGELGKNMIGPFVAKGKMVAFVAGNHDEPDLGKMLAKKYEIINIQNHAVIQDNVGIFGSGGANIGINFASEDELAHYIEKGFSYISKAKKKILLTHMHPKGSKIEKFSFPGSKSVTKAIYEFKPDIHVCGHIHEMEGFEEKIGNTRVICVGSRGKIFEI